MKNEGYMHSLDDSSRQVKTVPLPLAIGIIIVFTVVGGLSSYFLTVKKTTTTSTTSTPASVQTEKAAGIVDKTTFSDSATGVLREGGMEGEGNFHLERPGGISQNAYLTSSTVDLSKYIGKKVTVWGQTFQGQKAGWLMDVGLVEIK